MPDRKLNVLVIAYYFPPMGLSGVQRVLKFVKYLPEFGWNPIVVTAGETPYYAHDDSLLDEIAPLIEQGEIRIVRTDENGLPGAKKKNSTLKLPRASFQRLRSKVLQTFLQPDSRIGWKKHAMKAIDEIYKNEKIDAVFASAPPYTSFLIAKDIREKYGTPYLMDYRDAWVGNPVLNFYATPFHKAYARKLEDDSLRLSDAVTVVNRRMKEVLIENYNFLNHEDVDIIPHGYDLADIMLAKSADDVFSERKFRITYSGAFYVGRSPSAMLTAAKAAMQKEPGLARDLDLVFVGILQKEYQKLVKKLGMESNVTEKGYLDHIESIAALLQSDVLWMTMSDDISAPGKLYEYFGTRKTILGLVPKESQAERMLNEYGASKTVEPEDFPAITSAILTLYHRWKEGRLNPLPNDAFVRAFDRRLLTKELAKTLAMIVDVNTM